MRILSLIFYIILSINFKLFSQTDGINYQAVIIDPNPEEIPGFDISGNILPNKEIHVRFTISNSSGNYEYQEIHTTTTDEYGMINLVIGKGNQIGRAHV